MTELSRRSMLTGAAVAAAATAVGAPQSATAATPATADNMAAFVNLSVGLTGIDASRLAPAVDPVNVKVQYFAQAQTAGAFDALMAVAIANKTDPAAAADKVMNNADPGIKYLGRAILLAWYTGLWYAPATLLRYNQPNPPKLPPDPEKVISGTAYTQGWNWRIAQTHPMGYSEFIYGYWHKDPPSLADFIGKPV